MRILISYENRYHVYSDAMESALHRLRPEAEVEACRLGVIGEQVESFDPHLVVSSGPNTVDPGGGRHGTSSPPSPASHPRLASKGCAHGGRTRDWRSCCRSLTK